MISTPGIGSGLDVNGIVSQLMQIEQQKLNSLQVESNEYSTQLTSIGKIKNLISNFQTSADALKDLNTFKQYTATSSDDTKLNATITTNQPSLGEHTIVVSQLAQAHKIGSTNFAAKDTSTGASGTLQITVGSDSFTIDVDANNDSLEGIRDTINNALDNTGVQATILNIEDGMGTPEYRLVLTSTTSGADYSISLSDIAGNVATTLDMSTTINAAQDALFTVDGFNASSSSNIVTDVLEGVRLELKSDDATPLTLTIADDSEKTNEEITSAIQKMLDDYNAVVDEINITNANNGTDNTLTLIKTLMANTLETTLSSGTYISLAEIGISTETAVNATTSQGNSFLTSGRLTLDTVELQTALNTNFSAVKNLFDNSTEGYAIRFESLADNLLDIDGIIQNKTDVLNDQIEFVDDQITREEDYLDSVEEQLFLKFSQLDTILSQFQATENFVTSTLASFPVFNSNSNNDN